jgi:hypothetical protein
MKGRRIKFINDKGKFKLKQYRFPPKAPHNTNTYLITNKSDCFEEDDFPVGGTMKGILFNTLDCLNLFNTLE